MRIIELSNNLLEFKTEQDDSTIFHYFEIKCPYFKRYGTHLTSSSIKLLRENCRRILEATEFSEE